MVDIVLLVRFLFEIGVWSSSSWERDENRNLRTHLGHGASACIANFCNKFIGSPHRARPINKKIRRSWSDSFEISRNDPKIKNIRKLEYNVKIDFLGKNWNVGQTFCCIIEIRPSNGNFAQKSKFNQDWYTT